MKIDIVCPLYKAEKYIDGFIQKLNMQKDVDIQTVVFPLTRTDGCEKVAEKIESAGYTYFYVEPSDFSHSLTREEAIYLYCTQDIVVMLSQDVVLYDPYALSKLVSMIDEKVVFVYGRQVGKKKTIEEYIRHKNYGLTSYVISGDDVERLQIKAFFSSDAFSAYYRPVFIQLNGYDHADMMMNEDMYYSKKILDSGYCKGYAADAVVEHSHAFSFRQLYARYYETGRWFAEHPEFDEYDAVDSGLKLAFYILKMAIKDINFPVLIRWLPDMAARYLGVEDGAKVEMKIVGTVVIYNADESVINNILSYYDIVEVLFVCDNSTIANERLLNKLYALPKVRVIPMEGNRGIAAALASGLRAASETGCDYCLTMDQDSVFPTDKTDIIKNYLSAPDADDYGIIGLDFNNPTEEHSLKEVKLLLTSGNFINMKNYAQINGFMEELFIDYVDFELDEQFFNIGKKLAYITGVSLVHTIGNPITKKFFGIKFTCMNHSPVRYYYRFRNALYLYRSNKKFYGERYRHDLFIDIPKVILFERDKLKKLKMIAHGRRDARAGRLGEYKGSV